MSAATLVGLVVLAASPANAAPSDAVVRVSSKSFDDTTKQLKWQFGGHGITVVNTLDYQHILKKIEVDSQKSMIFEILRRPWVKTVLEHDPAAGLEIPLRVYVYERADGKTVVSYYKPSKLFDSEHEAFKAFGQKLDKKLEAIIQAAIR